MYQTQNPTRVLLSFQEFCMHIGLAACILWYLSSCTFQLSSTFLIILTEPRRYTSCNNSTEHTVCFTITVILLLMAFDTVFKHITIIGCIFTLFIFHIRIIFMLRELHMSIYPLASLVDYSWTKGARNINYIAHEMHLVDPH